MRKRIGLQIIDLEGSYSRMIWPDVAAVTRKAGFDLVLFPGHNPGYPHDYMSMHNRVYNLMDAGSLDCLILLTNTLGNFISAAELQEKVRVLSSRVPVVSLTENIEGVPSVLIDNESGVREAVRHLAERHGRRRFGQITGPMSNSEARIRLKSFREAVEGLGLALPDDNIFNGDFTEPAGSNIIRRNSGYIARNIDALFCANDNLALGALNALKNTGINVPGDISLIGFDDMEESRYQLTPLTTIRQPFSRTVRFAAELAIALARGEPVPPVTVFPTELVIRASCGCMVKPEAPVLPGDQEPESLEDFIKALLPDIDAGPLLNRVRELHDYLAGTPVLKESADWFLVMLDQVITEEMFGNYLFPDWNLILSNLVRRIKGSDHELFAEWQETGLFESARIMIGQKQELYQGYLRYVAYKEKTLPLRGLQYQLSLCLDREDLLLFLKDEITRFGMQECFICFDSDSPSQPAVFGLVPGLVTLFAINPGSRNTRISGLTLPFDGIVSACLEGEGSGRVLTVNALYFREHPYGLLVTPIPGYDATLNEGLRHHVSEALYNLQLIEARDESEKKLRDLLNDLEKHNINLKKQSRMDELTGLYNRRGFVQLGQTHIEEALARGESFMVFFSDMDGLKGINDTFGHSYGDMAIRDMADILKKIFRADDIVSRFAGDEFAILTANIPPDFLSIVHRRLANHLNQFNKSGQRPYSLSISMGAVKGDVSEGLPSLETILAEADTLLYDEKRMKHSRGRDQSSLDQEVSGGT
jgi:diguanylate cyclase (GGDEF)-like protein